MERLIACLLGAMLAAAAAADDGAKIVTAKGAYADVKDDLVAAIEQRGLVVNFVAHVGDMLERTGRDLGTTARVYGNAEVVEFCSATASRTMVQSDPQNLVYCPYTIAIYTLPNQPGVVYLAYRKYPPTPALLPIGNLVEGIVADVVK